MKIPFSPNYFPKYSPLILAALFVAMAFFFNYQRILFEPAQSIHQWRQSDCLSITTTYYRDHNPFFEPAMLFLGADGTGKTVSEFPIIYYTVARLWDLFGHHIWIYRLLQITIFFCGIMALHKTIEGETHNSFAGLFSSLILFSTPVLAYYSGNFLMNTSAFSFAAIGLFFIFRYRRTKHLIHLFLCCFFYLIGALLKISSLLTFIPFFLLYCTELSGLKALDFGVFKKTIKEALLLVSMPIIVFAWYRYAVYYNSQHTGGIFLVGILPLWDVDRETFDLVIVRLVHRLRWDYMRPFISIAILLAGLFVVFFNRYADRLVLYLTILVGIGSIMFCVLFFQALQWHDYYTIDLYMMTPLILLSFFTVLKNKFTKLNRSILLPLILFGILFHSADFTRRRMAERYDPNGVKNNHHRTIFQPFLELEPTLEELGIMPNDTVISISDYTINTTLVFMNRKGWTHYGTKKNPDRIKEKIQMGAKYFFVATDEIRNNEELKPFMKHHLGTYRNIDIFLLEKSMINM